MGWTDYISVFGSVVAAWPPADMAELSLPSNISIAFPEGKEKPTHFEIVIRPDEGLYK